MKITIMMGDVNLSMPVPLSMAGMAINAIPASVFQRMQAKAPPSYGELLCRENLRFLYEECKDELRQHRGLELLHVEGRDGSFVSIVI